MCLPRLAYLLLAWSSLDFDCRTTDCLRGCPVRMNPATIWTIGHSTRSLEDFISLLRSERVASS
jgi:hypothetical protein